MEMPPHPFHVTKSFRFTPFMDSVIRVITFLSFCKISVRFHEETRLAFLFLCSIIIIKE
jgi:hypothetical protein